MKKSIYFLMMFIGLAFTSCEPMEDIHEIVDAELEARPNTGLIEYTLTEDDYEELDISQLSFDSLEDASALIPGLLSKNFPEWQEGSLAQITFDLFAPIDPEEYTVTASDYEAEGLNDLYFSSSSQITDFLRSRFPQAATNDYVELTYRTIAVEIDYELTEDDFDYIGEVLGETYPAPASSAAQYSNFDRREDRSAYWSNEMILEAVNAVLTENFPSVEGQTYEVSYKIYDGSPGTETMNVKFDGNSYVLIGGTAYQLDAADYDLIGVELGTKYPGPASNAAQFNSFDVRSTSSNYWDDSMILEAINVVLMERYPLAEEGAQFDVTYAAYSGSVNSVIESVILSGGEYVIDETSSVSTVVETSVYAFGDGRWTLPLELPANIYKDEFGQRFNNFDNEADAGFYIGRYLEPLYPYAEDGDFASVRYKFYNGDATVDRYASFVYNEENREWDFIPSVIPQTLQFGHEETGWVVDNTILRTLTDADYTYIGDALMDKYPGPADSAKWFKNFDRREGNVNEWTDAMLLEAMNILLNEKVAPDAEEGQKYLLTFDIYDGRSGTEQMRVIKVGDAWTLVE